MSARTWLVALVAALVASLTTALAVAVVADDDGPPGWMADGRMSAGRMMPGAGMHGGMLGGMHGGMHGMDVDTEHAFLAEMVAHHEEAITAAKELARSARPEMRAFGESIVESQSAQVEQMEQWLDEWYPDEDHEADYDPVMRDLSRLEGDRLDRVFLEDMIGHHMAAVMMSQQLVARGLAEHEEVEALAEDIRDEQHDEIFAMQEWLRDWFDVAGRHGMHAMR
jgi:uncharacterized protein (DUF305 family)